MLLGLIRKFYKKDLTVDVLGYNGNLYEKVRLPGSYTSRSLEYIGRIKTIKKGHMVLFDKIPLEEDYIILQYIGFSYNSEKEYLEKFLSKIPSEINMEEDFIDFQKDYAVVYKKDSINFIHFKSEKKFFEIVSNSNYRVSLSASSVEISKYSGGSATKVFSFDPDGCKLSIEKSGKKVVINLSDTSSLMAIGKGDMNVVNTKELKDWMEKTQESIQGIIDAIKGGSPVPMDGGATLKSTISAGLTKEPPKVPDNIDSTNVKIGKKGE